MTDKRKAPDAPEGRRKRAAPTIDLTATEVPGEETASPEAPPHAEEAAPAAQPASEQHSEREPDPEREPVHRAGVFSVAGIVGGFVGAAMVVAALAALWAAGMLPIAPAGNGQDAQVPALQKQIAGLQQQMQQLQNRPPPHPMPKRWTRCARPCASSKATLRGCRAATPPRARG